MVARPASTSRCPFRCPAPLGLVPGTTHVGALGGEDAEVEELAGELRERVIRAGGRIRRWRGAEACNPGQAHTRPARGSTSGRSPLTLLAEDGARQLPHEEPALVLEVLRGFRHVPNVAAAPPAPGEAHGSTTTPGAPRRRRPWGGLPHAGGTADSPRDSGHPHSPGTSALPPHGRDSRFPKGERAPTLPRHIRTPPSHQGQHIPLDGRDTHARILSPPRPEPGR